MIQFVLDIRRVQSCSGVYWTDDDVTLGRQLTLLILLGAYPYSEPGGNNRYALAQPLQRRKQKQFLYYSYSILICDITNNRIEIILLVIELEFKAKLTFEFDCQSIDEHPNFLFTNYTEIISEVRNYVSGHSHLGAVLFY